MDRIGAAATFLRAVGTGSFNRVAAEMGTTPPTISEQIAARLGVQLFLLSTRALALTEEGARFHAATRGAAEAFAGAAARGAGAVEGTLRVGYPVAFGPAQRVPRLGALLDAHPGLGADLVMSDAFLDPVERGVDVVLRAGVLRASALIARRIGATRRVAMAAPRCLDRRGAPRALADHDCPICTRLAAGAERPFREVERTVLVPVRGRVRADSSTAMRETALAGLGVALLPPCLGDGDLAAGRLLPMPRGHEPEPLPIHALPPPRRFAPPEVAAFVDHLALALRGDPAVAP